MRIAPVSEGVEDNAGEATDATDVNDRGLEDDWSAESSTCVDNVGGLGVEVCEDTAVMSESRDCDVDVGVCAQTSTVTTSVTYVTGITDRTALAILQ